jgi:hypothetical protein
MPLIEPSSYIAPPLLRGSHRATILPSVLRIVTGVRYRRERLELPDGDFIDLDWADGPRPEDSGAPGSALREKLIILSHGLEGNSRGAYVLGMARAFTRNGWDALAWNFRGCSGEKNRLLRTYHGGVSDDLDLVVRRALREKRYRQIVLAGFSMGGNITLKYLGERGSKIDRRIRASVTFSVPCHFEACSEKLADPSNRVYMWKFLASLRRKVRGKKAAFPTEVDDRDLHLIKDFRGFDDRFTAPTHGFKDARDYWTQVSSLNFIDRIRVPTLLVNARNDPFLAAACFPYEQARKSKWLHFEAPAHGGHVGFARFHRDGLFWSEKRALEFIEGALAKPAPTGTGRKASARRKKS